MDTIKTSTNAVKIVQSAKNSGESFDIKMTENFLLVSA